MIKFRNFLNLDSRYVVKSHQQAISIQFNDSSLESLEFAPCTNNRDSQVVLKIWIRMNNFHVQQIVSQPVLEKSVNTFLALEFGFNTKCTIAQRDFRWGLFVTFLLYRIKFRHRNSCQALHQICAHLVCVHYSPKMFDLGIILSYLTLIMKWDTNRSLNIFKDI